VVGALAMMVRQYTCSEALSAVMVGWEDSPDVGMEGGVTALGSKKWELGKKDAAVRGLGIRC